MVKFNNLLLENSHAIMLLSDCIILLRKNYGRLNPLIMPIYLCRQLVILNYCGVVSF